MTIERDPRQSARAGWPMGASVPLDLLAAEALDGLSFVNGICWVLAVPAMAGLCSCALMTHAGASKAASIAVTALIAIGLGFTLLILVIRASQSEASNVLQQEARARAAGVMAQIEDVSASTLHQGVAGLIATLAVECVRAFAGFVLLIAFAVLFMVAAALGDALAGIWVYDPVLIASAPLSYGPLRIIGTTLWFAVVCVAVPFAIEAGLRYLAMQSGAERDGT